MISMTSVVALRSSTLISYFGQTLTRSATRGRNGKTAVLPGFLGIEPDGHHYPNISTTPIMTMGAGNVYLLVLSKAKR